MTRGLVIGKFYPPHLGHQSLIAFACDYVDELTVVVEKMPNESITAQQRLEWLVEIFPSVNFLLLEDYNPQAPEEHVDFWAIWQASLLCLHPQSIEYVFASEEYGEPLAGCLNAQFVPVDPSRMRFNISGTKARASLLKQWQYLTRPVQKNFQQRICICGPESTGKTTLSQWLHTELNSHSASMSTLIPEYARTYLEHRTATITAKDIDNIARGQYVCEQLDVGSVTPFLVVDTGVEASKIWSEHLFDKCSPTLLSLCESAQYDLYLLCRPDVPWVKDEIRYLPESSDAFFSHLKAYISSKSTANVVEVSGSWHERNLQALAACMRLKENLKV